MLDTRLRTPQLSRWQCDATAELRGSAEAQATDKNHAPTSHGSRVRDSAALSENHTVSAKTTTKRLGAFFGIWRTAWGTQSLKKEVFAAPPDGTMGAVPSSRAFKVAFGLTEITIHFEVQRSPSKAPRQPHAKATDSLAQSCVSFCPYGSLGWRADHHLLIFLRHVEVSQHALGQHQF